MKTQSLKALSLFASLGLACLISSGNFAYASGGGSDDGGSGGSGGEQHSGSHGGAACYKLLPTASAPLGAQGRAFVVPNGGSPVLKVALRGMSADTYTVGVTSLATGSSSVLGTFQYTPSTRHSNGAEFHVSLVSLAFAAGMDPKDVASVQVYNSSAVLLLSGTLSSNLGESEDHHDDFRLVATANAPAGAEGEAHLGNQALDSGTGTVPVLEVEVKNLAPATYTVSVTSLSTGSSSALGTFDVPAQGAGDDNESEAQAAIAFPAGVDPQDISSVQVSDATGLVILTGDGDLRGGDLDGAEHLEQKTILSPTVDAPAGSAGWAKIEAEDEHGLTHAHLNIATSGLVAGTYTVSVSSLASGTVTVLGTIDVAAPTTEVDSEFGDGSALAFPDGFNPLDIGGIQVSDASDVVLLAGDFSSPAGLSTSFLKAKVSTIPGIEAPNSTGSSTLTARVKHHSLHQQFSLTAKGAPANSVLSLLVNGVPSGSVNTSRKGGVSIHKLPKGIDAHKITSVTLEDANGQEVLTADF